MAHPDPKPNPSKAPFPLLALPTEVRLQIHNYLLLSVPTSYGYTHATRPARAPSATTHPFHNTTTAAPSSPPLRRHGMLLVNRQLNAEYTQAFYERTSFFFFIDANNGTRPATTPFWTLSPALLPNLRRCKLYIEFRLLVLVPNFPVEALVARIEALLELMERVRRVHLVWDLGGMIKRPIEGERELWSTGSGTGSSGSTTWNGLGGEERLWERLGERFVRYLKGRFRMQEMIVTVGSRILRLERKGAEWVERGLVPY